MMGAGMIFRVFACYIWFNTGYAEYGGSMPESTRLDPTVLMY